MFDLRTLAKLETEHANRPTHRDARQPEVRVFADVSAGPEHYTLALPDGRLVYIDRSHIRFIEGGAVKASDLADSPHYVELKAV